MILLWNEASVIWVWFNKIIKIGHARNHYSYSIKRPCFLAWANLIPLKKRITLAKWWRMTDEGAGDTIYFFFSRKVAKPRRMQSSRCNIITWNMLDVEAAWCGAKIPPIADGTPCIWWFWSLPKQCPRSHWRSQTKRFLSFLVEAGALGANASILLHGNVQSKRPYASASNG